jgi:hypothetical protein
VHFATPRLGPHSVSVPLGPAAARNKASSGPSGPAPRITAPTLIQPLANVNGNTNTRGRNHTLPNSSTTFGKWNEKSKVKRGAGGIQRKNAFLARSKIFREYLLGFFEEGRNRLEKWLPQGADGVIMSDEEDEAEMDWQPEGEFRIVYVWDQALGTSVPVDNNPHHTDDFCAGEKQRRRGNPTTVVSPTPKDTTVIFRSPDAGHGAATVAGSEVPRSFNDAVLGLEVPDPNMKPEFGAAITRWNAREEEARR